MRREENHYPKSHPERNVLVTPKALYPNCVSSAVFSQESKLLASASFSHRVRVWDAGTGCLQQTVSVDSNISGLSCDSTDSNLLADIGRIETGPSAY